ncbi:MAG: response regulator transcription factor [Flavobacteriales bacterium]|jgi:two-component system alkaline phosphatase synthesis response regulator PhoP|nr:response regulator transcription factor [Flavobacteriales bacterium]|tara:strand:+ start:1988 stop:2668 length:681 start_codon:yes stop_codon:yes gene_type:complete
MNNEIKILVVDDEEDILEFLGYNLRAEGYEVIVADNGLLAIELAKKHEPSLIILDVQMPNMDGITTCEKIREIPSLSQSVVTFLTARSEDYSQIAGFEAGADDYITKPIRPKVLISRVKALLKRRGITQDTTSIIELGDIVIDKEKHMTTYKGVEVVFAKKEFKLLKLLISKPGKVFTREEILEKVWGTDIVVGDRTIDVHIRKLREKLADHYIKTVKGVGYKFEY